MDELDYFQGGKPSISDNGEADVGTEKSLDRMDTKGIAKLFSKMYGVERAEFDTIFKDITPEEYEYYSQIAKAIDEHKALATKPVMKVEEKSEEKHPSNVIDLSEPNPATNESDLVDRSKSVQNTEDNFTKERNAINNPQPEVLQKETFNPGPALDKAASKGNQGDRHMKRIVYASLGECKVSDLQQGDYFSFVNNPTVYRITAADGEITQVSDAFGGDYKFQNSELEEENIEKLQPTEPDKIVFSIFDPVVLIDDNKKQGYVIYQDPDEQNEYVVTWDTKGEEISPVMADEIAKLDTEVEENLLEKLKEVKTNYEKMIAEEGKAVDNDVELGVAASQQELTNDVNAFKDFLKESIDASDVIECIKEDLNLQEEKNVDGTIESYVPEVLAMVAGLDIENYEHIYIRAAKEFLAEKMK